MKRAKQTEKMIGAVNEYLRNNNIKNQNDCVFVTFSYALLEAGVYGGYSYCKRKTLGGQEVLVPMLNQENSDCLQFL